VEGGGGEGGKGVKKRIDAAMQGRSAPRMKVRVLLQAIHVNFCLRANC
jgi:hypothetical protein